MALNRAQHQLLHGDVRLTDLLLGNELRFTVHHGLQNIGLVSAFMAALAGQVYTEVPEEPKCYGRQAISVILPLQWIAMGCFFFSTAASVILSLDVDGVPNRLLPQHLEDTAAIFTLPYLSTLIGIILMPAGYAIDIGERNGCHWSYIGFAAAPCFAFGVISVGWWVRKKRKSLNCNGYHLPETVASNLGPAPTSKYDTQTQPTLAQGDEEELVHSVLSQYRPQLGCHWFTPYSDRIAPNSWLETLQGLPSNANRHVHAMDRASSRSGSQVAA